MFHDKNQIFFCLWEGRGNIEIHNLFNAKIVSLSFFFFLQRLLRNQVLLCSSEEIH